MAALREARDDDRVAATLGALAEACSTGENVVPRILDCARADCTLYEIRASMESVVGAYKEPVFF
jgi:methylmalonyl-CoA mutase N-terminal domain/subunit